jgi:hypothetical protein
MDIQIIIALATVAVSAGIAWGVSQNRLKVHETRITAIESSYKIDHDVVNRHDDFVALTKTDHDIVSKLDDFITTARADHDVLIKHDDFITTA